MGPGNILRGLEAQFQGPQGPAASASRFPKPNGNRLAPGLWLVLCRGGAFIAAALSAIGCWPAWQTLSPEKAGFSVEFPSGIKCRPDKVVTPQRSLVGELCYSSEASRRPGIQGEVRYIVSWIRIPSDLGLSDRAELFQVIKSNLGGEPDQGVEVRKSEDRDVLLGGEQAKEFEVHFVYDPRVLPREPESWKVRTCIHDGSLYSLVVVGSPEDFGNWDRVSDSFRFLDG